jgi:flagellar hook assembly protein FlgD
MEKEGPVTVTIFDIAGERVYEQQYERGEPGTGAGPQEVTWDGRNTKGEVVRNGIYVCQLEAAGKTVKIRIAVAK